VPFLVLRLVRYHLLLQTFRLFKPVSRWMHSYFPFLYLQPAERPSPRFDPRRGCCYFERPMDLHSFSPRELVECFASKSFGVARLLFNYHIQQFPVQSERLSMAFFFFLLGLFLRRLNRPSLGWRRSWSLSEKIFGTFKDFWPRPCFFLENFSLQTFLALLLLAT